MRGNNIDRAGAAGIRRLCTESTGSRGRARRHATGTQCWQGGGGGWMRRVRGAIGGCQQLLQKERGNQRMGKVFKAPDLCRIDTVVGRFHRKGEGAGQW